jgi:hypothetical protein
MPQPQSGRERAPRYLPFLVAIVAGAAVGAGFATVLLAGPWNPPVGLRMCACPPAWSIFNETNVTSGATGCQNAAGEVCYSVTLVSHIGGVNLSGLRFELLGPPTNSNDVQSGLPVSLGPSALVSVLDPAGVTVGKWNWTDSSWTVGRGWPIPVSANITLVVDTGLQDVQLTADLFWVFMVTPDYGSVGTTLL